MVQAGTHAQQDGFTPEPATAGSTRRPLSPLVGRDEEMARLRAQLLAREAQVLTLTGPSGVGKTRLATELWDDVIGAFRDGGCYLDLADQHDPTGAVRAALGDGPTHPDHPTGEASDHPTDLPTGPPLDLDFLLVLDCGSRPPQEVSALVAEFAARAPRLSVLTVATQVLGVYGERRIQLAPLAVPGAAGSTGPLADVASVRLLVQRTRAVRPGFKLTEENRDAIAQLCVRLDGLPLALELAAARLKVSSPRALLEELDRSCSALRGTAADTMSPHLSIFDAVQHSWAVLDPRRRALLTRLAVFASPFDGAEAGEVLGLSVHEARAALEEFVDRSLLLPQEQPDGSIRFRLLRTSRAYAWEQLADEDGLEPIRNRHAAHVLRRARAAAAQLGGAGQAAALAGLGHTHRDTLAALDHLVHVGDGDKAAELATASLPYWLVRGEAREATVRLTAARAAGVTSARGRARLAAALGEAQLLAGRYAQAGAELRTALAQHAADGDLLAAVDVQEVLARLAHAEGDLEGAKALLDDVVKQCRELAHEPTLASATGRLAEVHRDLGDLPAAARYGQEAVRRFDDLRDARRAALGRLVLAGVAADGEVAADAEQAVRTARAALSFLHGIGDRPALSYALYVTADLLVRRHGRTTGAWERAAQLLSAARSLEKAHGGLPVQLPAAARQELLTQAGQRLGEAAFDEHSRAGARLTAHEAVTLATAPLAPPPTAPQAPPAADTLTRREQEVAALVAEGLTNREVARRLGTAEWTAVNILRKVMRKLDCTSRVQVANRVLSARAAADSELGGPGGLPRVV
ncbi:ATP-binding protein [Streptomyces sp. 796.1]|uniref:ATP-binding protein n=1 Tax=Streptomyces sp. 796.1 TaxID=3163029 RepID=UPI0039C9F889